MFFILIFTATIKLTVIASSMWYETSRLAKSADTLNFKFISGMNFLSPRRTRNPRTG